MLPLKFSVNLYQPWVFQQEFFRRIRQAWRTFTQNVFQERKNKNIIIRPVFCSPRPSQLVTLESKPRQSWQIQCSSALESRAEETVWIQEYVNSIWFSEISGRKLFKKQSLRKLPKLRLTFLFCFYYNGKTPGRNRYKLPFIDSVEGRLWTVVLIVKAVLEVIQLISQSKFIQVHHHFTFNLLYNTI